MARRLCAAWVLLAVLAPVHAGTTLHARMLHLQGMALHDIDVSLDRAPDGQLQWSVQVGRADVPALGWHGVGFLLQGQLQRLRADVWSSQGTVTVRAAPGGLLRKGQPYRITLDTGADTLEVDIGPQPRPTISMALPLDQLTHVQSQLTRMPVSWLQGLVAGSGTLGKGTLSGTVAVDKHPSGVAGSAVLNLRRAGFDGGRFAAQKLDFRGRVNFRTDAKSRRISVAGVLQGGEVLLGPLYARLPRTSTQLGFTLSGHGGAWRVDGLRYADPGTLNLAGRFALARDGSLHSVDISRFQASFPAAYQRYGKTWLATHGLADLTTKGRLGGALAMHGGSLRRLRVQAGDFGVVDGAGRFRVQGLDGGIDWSRQGDRGGTSLSWKSLAMYRVVFGQGTSQWRSQGGTLKLQSPISVPVLGGQFDVQDMAWQPAAPKGQRLDARATLDGVSMRKLSLAMGWPEFHGTLAGAVPGLRYDAGRLTFQGGLTLHVFGGFVDVTRLALTHLFGAAPELSADIDLQQLDLKAMTDVFHFGSISGRMHGTVHGLRLVDWKPVAFQAQLLADGGGRISQRAVSNLTSVGGGSAIGGIQGTILRLFKHFGYARIGLSCTLQGNTCRMGGLGPEDNGYLIVEGDGLPHLTVIGHQRQVSWPTLISRLRAAIRSGGPVVK